MRLKRGKTMQQMKLCPVTATRSPAPAVTSKPLRRSSSDEASFFDGLTNEDVDKFNALMDECEEEDRKLKRNSYREQPDGYTIDDLADEIEKKAAAGDTPTE